MSADTLAPDGAAVTIAPPPPEVYGPGQSAPYMQTGFAVLGADPNEILVAAANSVGDHQLISGYDLSGNLLFRDDLGVYAANGPSGNALLATIPGGGVAAAWLQFTHENGTTTAVVDYGVVGADGAITGFAAALGGQGSANALQAFSANGGFALEWTDIASGGQHPGQAFTEFNRYHADGSLVSDSALGGSFPWADIALAGGEFATDGYLVSQTGQPNTTLPGEPQAATTDVAAAALADGHTAAVAWVDSGTDYVSLFDANTNSFTPRAGLDWGGAADLHVVALPDGGFAVSWQNGGAYKGELFDSTGAGGGIMPLTGQFAAVDTQGDLYTVGLDSSGAEVVQTYAINGGSSGGGGSSVSTSAANYTAPDGVTSITLTGSQQTIHANNAGDTIFSNDTGNYLYGGTGNDTFHMGRGGDWAAGGGGNDTYDFAGIPWAAGGIIGFDGVLDLSGLLSTTQDIPAGGFSDGYLQLTDDGSGDTDVWARYATSGPNSNWWLVTVLEGLTTSQLDAHHTVVTLAPSAGDVTTSASDYVAPSYVTSITLTGSQQTIDASATHGVTIASNDTGNVLIGGPGDDAFFLGRGGDWVAGGAGADTFAYQATPWTPGGITDFNAAGGDRIDVTRLLQASGYTGSDPFADGYLKYGTDGSGNAQLWSDVNQPGNTGWWLVATLDGVQTSSLHYANGLIT